MSNSGSDTETDSDPSTGIGTGSEVNNKRDADEAPPLPTTASSPSCSQIHYDTANGCKKILFAMCTGLVAAENERILGEFNVEPYKSAKNKKLFKPTRQDFVDEVYRRLQVFGRAGVRADNWTTPDLKSWLQENKITNNVDVQFLLEEELKFYNSLVRAQKENAALQPATGVVFTQTADLRMVHCLLEDDVKEAFLRRHDSWERDALDARRSPFCPKSWLEKIADKFNCEDFSPHSEVHPTLHDDFLEPIDLGLVHCPGPVTIEQVKAWIGDRKAKLVLFIDRWERSGNGEGQRMEGDANYGHMDQMNFQADNRSSFLKNDRSSLLYYWEMLDKYDILQETVSILPRDLGVSSMVALSLVSEDSAVTNGNNVGSAKKKQRRNDGKDGTEQEERNKQLTDTLRLIASQFQTSDNLDRARTKNLALERLQKAEESVVRFLQLVKEADDMTTRAFFEERLAKAKTMLEEAELDYGNVN